MGSPDPAKCDTRHTKTAPETLNGRPGLLTVPVVPITNYAARVLTTRAAASNAPFRPTGAPAPYLLPGLLPAVTAPPRCAHALTAVDDHGRTRPGGLVAPLAWTPKTSLVCAVTDAAAVLTADPSGVPLLDPQGRLCLPLAARRALGLTPGSRALLTVCPGRLTVRPATVLDTLTAVTNA
jgi:hypothetical protein